MLVQCVGFECLWSRDIILKIVTWCSLVFGLLEVVLRAYVFILGLGVCNEPLVGLAPA